MAKSKQTHPLFMHVPTKIGFTIVGITVMVYGLYLAAGYSANTRAETMQSQAAYCPVNKKPACGNTNNAVCQGGFWHCTPKVSPSSNPKSTLTPAPKK